MGQTEIGNMSFLMLQGDMKWTPVSTHRPQQAQLVRQVLNKSYAIHNQCTVRMTSTIPSFIQRKMTRICSILPCCEPQIAVITLAYSSGTQPVARTVQYQ
eukprot:GHRR01004329.1.p2 GENE.GHRR01004329.1~~GHRR01004329.1.p2  ORF type:complete len:100 (+),score=7.43 GHRR01004329.1:1022-1321(+)